MFDSWRSRSPRRSSATTTGGRHSGWGARIFATLWDERHMNVMLGEPVIRTAVQANPASCDESWYIGTRA
jgi:hypothetical protein